MLETMLALKNNDMRKIPGYDPEPVDRLRKVQRALVSGCLLPCPEPQGSRAPLGEGAGPVSWGLREDRSCPVSGPRPPAQPL